MCACATQTQKDRERRGHGLSNQAFSIHFTTLCTSCDKARQHAAARVPRGICSLQPCVFLHPSNPCQSREFMDGSESTLCTRYPANRRGSTPISAAVRFDRAFQIRGEGSIFLNFRERTSFRPTFANRPYRASGLVIAKSPISATRARV